MIMTSAFDIVDAAEQLGTAIVAAAAIFVAFHLGLWIVKKIVK